MSTTRRFLGPGLLVAGLVLASLGAAQDPGGESLEGWPEGVPDPALQARIDDLLLRLADPSWEVRDQAERDLQAIGGPALKSLRAAAASENPEVRTRVQDLLRNVRVFEAFIAKHRGNGYVPMTPDDAAFARDLCSKKTGLPPERRFDLGEGVTLVMALIPPGEFTMEIYQDWEIYRGSGHQDPGRTVTSKPFYLGTFEVRQCEWERVMGSNPSHFKGADHPVEDVSWEDCRVFVEKLSALAGEAFAIPSEAQWEYACRAGTDTPYHFGTVLERKNANFFIQEEMGAPGIGNGTTRVGSFPPNAWGLHDMHGNVYEWCLDWRPGHLEVPETKRIGGHLGDPVATKSFSNIPEKRTRILRGGGWLTPAERCTSGHRSGQVPVKRDYFYGFRVALPAGESKSD
jgi:formylglycine-generating enzyme required for sulfatase activity